MYCSTEHAYQAAKTLDENEWQTVRLALTPGIAKKLGALVTLRSDWDDVKLGVMEELLRKKFNASIMQTSLLATGKSHLEETNTWNDTFWGVCNGIGENHLGKLLMKIRQELRDEAELRDIMDEGFVI